MADKKSKSAVISELIKKINQSEDKPLLSKEAAKKIATKVSTIDLGDARVEMHRKQVGEPETFKGTLEDAIKRAAASLQQAAKDNPDLAKENLQARVVIMDGDSDQGKAYNVNLDGSYSEADDDDPLNSFPTHSAIEMVKILDKRMDRFGGDHHKDTELPNDPNQAAIIRSVNKLHKQRHEQVETLVELLAAVATYEAVAEQSPAEMAHSGDLRMFIECCNKTILKVLSANGCICTLHHALEHIPVPGHSKLEISKVN